MKYIPPFGSPDPNAGYIDRNTSSGTSGSRVPAPAVEHPQREIMAVIAAAGIEPSSGDLTQLLQAITNLIDAATGGAGDPNYVLMTEARTRIPIFPEVLTSDGRLPVTSPVAGTVRIPAGYDFLHRGIFNITTVQVDFATAASKTYHLRWSKSSGFALKDLADTGYNPAALAETHASFDSSYDDMLIARVVTNPSNTPTITTLANRDRLKGHHSMSGVSQAASGDDSARFGFSASFNWARTPINKALSTLSHENHGGATDNDLVTYSVYPTVATELPVTRYGVSFTQLRDFTSSTTLTIDIGA